MVAKLSLGDCLRSFTVPHHDIEQNIDKTAPFITHFLPIYSSLFRFMPYPNQAEFNVMHLFFRPSILLSTQQNGEIKRSCFYVIN